MRPLTAFEQRLALIAVAALAVRVIAAIATNDHLVQGDAMTFHQGAQHLADGEGFRQPFADQPTAEHPPAWYVVLAVADLLGLNGYLGHRLVGALVGTLTVAGVGLLGRRVAGPAVGLVAAAIAAAYPMLWAADVSLMSEPLYGLLVVVALLAALRLRDRPTRGRAATLGAILGLAALTRGEALLLLGLLVLPLACLSAPTWRGRAVLAGVAAGACLLVIAPWTIRNLATFDEPVLISTNANTIWIGSNCPDTYAGDLVGYWRFQCFTPVRPGEDEAAWSVRQREQGLAYARDHLDRLPKVVVARVARLLEVWDVPQSLYINAQEGRPPEPMRWAIRAAWVLMLLAVPGAILLARRRAPLVELLSVVALTLLLAVVFYGMTRFRFAAEPALCVLAAAALVGAARAARLPGRAWPRPTSSGISRR